MPPDASVGLFGVGVDFVPDCMSAGSAAGNFINNEMWLSWNSQNKWVETGLNATPDVRGGVPHFFWAWKNDAGQYTQHHDMSYTPLLRHDHPMSIVRIANPNGGYSNDYHIQGGSGLFPPFNVSTSGGPSGNANNVHTGIEATVNGANFGRSESMDWWDGAYWHSDWTDFPSLSIITVGSGATASWVTRGSWLHYQINACPSAAAAPSAATSTAADATPITEQDAVTKSVSVANLNGTPDGQAEVVPSTRGIAVSAIDSGANVDSSARPVYVVTQTGNFTGEGLSHPPGADAPGGTVLTTVVDAATGDVSDITVGTTQPDLTSLGSVDTVAASPSTPAQ